MALRAQQALEGTRRARAEGPADVGARVRSLRGWLFGNPLGQRLQHPEQGQNLDPPGSGAGGRGGRGVRGRGQLAVTPAAFYDSLFTLICVTGETRVPWTERALLPAGEAAGGRLSWGSPAEPGPARSAACAEAACARLVVTFYGNHASRSDQRTRAEPVLCSGPWLAPRGTPPASPGGRRGGALRLRGVLWSDPHASRTCS